MWSLLILACGPSPTVDAAPQRVLPLCPPWGALLPMFEGAAVVQCDPRHLTLRLPASGRTAEDLREALSAGGWRAEIDERSPGLANARYRRDEAQLAVSVIDTDPYTLVIASQIAASAP